MSNVFVPWTGWKVVKPLGQGGFGAVFQIERTGATGGKESSAMKVIHIPRDENEIASMRDAGYSEDGIQKTLLEQKNRILAEYDFMAAMSGNPNVVQCFDRKTLQHVNGYGWDVYIRMELLAPLTKVMQSNPLQETDTIRLGKDICSALQACHAKNIIHRDIKPANILKSSYGNYKLGDFGIARIMDHTTYATLVGTMYYMAPEVRWGEKYGKEVDFYSLGLVLYWLLNNKRLPFEPKSGDLTADAASEAQEKRLKGDKIPPPMHGSEALKRIVLKAISFQPQDRYSSAQQMLHALERAEKSSVNGEYSYSFKKHSSDSGGGNNDGEYSYSFKKSTSDSGRHNNDGEYSFRFEKKSGNSSTGSVGWKDDTGTVGNEDYKRHIHEQTDETVPEFGTESKTPKTPRTPKGPEPEVIKPLQKQRQEDPERAERIKVAHTLSVLIPVFTILAFFGYMLYSYEEFSFMLLFIAAFCGFGVTAMYRSGSLPKLASFVFGCFAFVDVMLFAEVMVGDLSEGSSTIIPVLIGLIICVLVIRALILGIDTDE